MYCQNAFHKTKILFAIRFFHFLRSCAPGSYAPLIWDPRYMFWVLYSIYLWAVVGIFTCWKWFSRSLITNLISVFQNSKWRIQDGGRKTKKDFNHRKIWYMTVFGVTDNESDITFTKHPRWWIQDGRRKTIIMEFCMFSEVFGVADTNIRSFGTLIKNQKAETKNDIW